MDSDGKATIRDHLKKAEASTGRTPERLNTPPVPEVFIRHIKIWQQLNHRRPAGGMGPGSVTYSELQAYCLLTGEKLSPLDMEILDIIEAQYFESYAEARKRTARKGHK